jgi:hypothetical protein
MTTTAIDSLRGILNGFRDLNSKGIYTMNGTETDLLRQILLEVQALSIGGGGIADGSVTPAKLSQPYTQGNSFALSGAAYDVTGVPSWATSIVIKLQDLSTNGTSRPVVQLGDTGGIENTGYDCIVTSFYNTPFIAIESVSEGLAFLNFAGPDMQASSIIRLELVSASSNLWAMDLHGTAHDVVEDPFPFPVLSFASKTLSAPLDRIRFTTIGGVDTFDGGVASISWQ